MNRDEQEQIAIEQAVDRSLKTQSEHYEQQIAALKTRIAELEARVPDAKTLGVAIDALEQCQYPLADATECPYRQAREKLEGLRHA